MWVRERERKSKQYFNKIKLYNTTVVNLISNSRRMKKEAGAGADKKEEEAEEEENSQSQ